MLTVYLLKDDLKQLWRYRSQTWARKFWKSWKRRALRSGLEALKVFVRRLEPYLQASWRTVAGLWAPIRSRASTTKIKVIKRMAYGYRDDHYFFLKIRAAFPGLG